MINALAEEETHPYSDNSTFPFSCKSIEIISPSSLTAPAMTHLA
jgi:hypothetical protein